MPCRAARRVPPPLPLLLRLPLRGLLLLAALLLPGCGDEPAPAPPPTPFVPGPEDVARHNAALGEMGRFEFEKAVPLFEAVLAAAPGWDDARVNLAVALLNTQDVPNLDRAVAELGRVLERDPRHVRARFVLGLLRLYRGEAERALPLFEGVATEDPSDAAAASWVGDCLKTLQRYEEALVWYRRAVALDPYLRNAWYAGFQCLQALDRMEEGRPLFQEFERLADNPLARQVEFKYSRMGAKGYALPGAASGARAAPPRRLDGALAAAPVPLALAGRAVVWSSSPGPASAADVDGDGRLDLLLLDAEVVEGGTRHLLLRGTAAGYAPWDGAPFLWAGPATAALWGDLDNDGRVDLYLCRRGANALYRQRPDGAFEDVTAAAQAGGGGSATVDGLLADLDHDGDLDIYLVNADGPCELLSNNLDGTFRPLGASTGVGGDGRPARGALALDLDGDRDLDLLLLKAAPPHEVLWNERLWAWRREAGPLAAFAAAPARAVAAADGDGDGVPEVLTTDGAELTTFARGADGRYAASQARLLPSPSTAPVLAVLDLDGDGRLDLAAGAEDGVSVRALANGTGTHRQMPGRGLLPLTDDPQAGPRLLRVVAGGPPQVLAPVAAPGRFAGLTFSGRHQEADSMRSNASGLGVRLVAQVGALGTLLTHLRPTSGPGQSLLPLLVGLGDAERLDHVTLLWPDGLLQTETGLEAGRVHRLEEVQRQTSSCPVLFCWDGSKHAFVTDLLGVGGIGFWVAPDTYAPPLPREHVLLPEGLPVAKDGRFVLKLGEPMEETCYLDAADLVAWDLPPGVALVLDERMAVLGAPPTSAPRFVRHEVLPVRARDHAGADVTDSVRRADRRAAPVGPLDHRFLGRTQGSVLTLEFDVDLDSPPARWPGAEALLVVDGWIEYPYASTLFAAWQAGAPYLAPTLEARGADGAWRVVAEQWGYPAGMPRTAVLPLPPLPAGTRALRLSGTYEVYWDRVSVAWSAPCPEAVRRVLPRRTARLDAAGFARRSTGPQRLPHYDWERRTPLWDCRHQKGLYTRLGDVEALLAARDDALVVFGPGEEVHLEYDAALPPLAPGATRRFVLETAGWCKDMDLATRDGDTVGPLPLREGVPSTPARDALHAATLTRAVR